MSNSKRQPTGVLDRNRMYTTSACSRELGFGRQMLWEARRAGVKARAVGHTHWYSGAELADWIEGKLEARSGQSAGAGIPSNGSG